MVLANIQVLSTSGCKKVYGQKKQNKSVFLSCLCAYILYLSFFVAGLPKNRLANSTKHWEAFNLEKYMPVSRMAREVKMSVILYNTGLRLFLPAAAVMVAIIAWLIFVVIIICHHCVTQTIPCYYLLCEQYLAFTFYYYSILLDVSCWFVVKLA